ncbi:MAG TPA: ATP-binding protein, partial [Telluria sp.]|jgi:two-component system CheB/CheR fusion protein
MDRNGLITSFNSGAERIFGYREEEILGQSDVLIFTPEDRAAGVPDDEKRRAREEGRAEDERWHLRKDGSRFFCSGVMTPLMEGEFNGYAKIGRDLTGRREAEKGREDQLIHQQTLRNQALVDNAQKDEFLAIMAHELKHPLNLIHMHSEVLLRLPVVQNSAPVVKAVTAIRSSTIGQAKIINDLLDLSRVSTGKMALKMTNVDLGALVSTISEVVGAAPNGPKVSIHLPPPETLMVNADEVRLEQVVWNLLSNAIKFTPPDGSVTIKLSHASGQAILEVGDTGIGIRPEILPTIFDLFKQDRVSNFRGSNGLGIGLALVKQIILLHGGDVSAASAGAGQGSTFTVALPLSMAQQDDAGASKPLSQVLGGLNLLLVDDNADSLAVFSMLLEMEGATVQATQSPKQALGMLDQAKFDLIVSDIHMPGMDGLAFVSAVREHADYRFTPALAVTGMGRQQDIDEAIAAGFSGHLSKPVDMHDLARQVESLLNKAAN